MKLLITVIMLWLEVWRARDNRQLRICTIGPNTLSICGNQWCCGALRRKESRGGSTGGEKKDKMCGCKEICLECRVRECMTENHGGKLCPASRLARAQNTWAQETESQTVVGDSGACPTKMLLNKWQNTPRRLGLSVMRICGEILSDRGEYETSKNRYTWGENADMLQLHKNNTWTQGVGHPNKTIKKSPLTSSHWYTMIPIRWVWMEFCW